MRLLISNGFIKILTAVLIILVSFMLMTCDDNKNDNNQLLPFLILANAPTQLLMFKAGPHDGNLKGSTESARIGADAMCNASVDKPDGIKNVHAFVTIGLGDQISNMATKYGYPTDLPIYGAGGLTLVANNWADVLDGSINMNLNAAAVLPLHSQWWSGSNQDGTYNGTVSECSLYTDATNPQQSFVGNADYSDSNWIHQISILCDDITVQHYILCIGEK